MSKASKQPNLELLRQKLPVISQKAKNALAIGVDENHHISRLEELGLSQRLLNLFEENQIENLADLLTLSLESLLKLKNLGEKQVILIFTALSNYHKID